MRKFLIVMTPILIIGAAIAGFAILQATQPLPEKADEPEIRPTSLYVVPVEQETITLMVESQGTVVSRTEIDLVAQVGGKIVAVSPAFAGGGIFRAGDTLLQIEPADYEYAVIQAKARIADQALILAQEEARAEVARKQWNWDEVTDKPTALALKEPNVAQARANLASAQAQLDRAELDLARTKISAPFNGRVRTKNADLGQYISPGSPLGQVFSTDMVEVRLPLTDRQMAELDLPIAYEAKSYETAPIVMLSAVLAGKGHQWTGRLMRTDAAIDQSTRLFHAIAQVRDPYGAGSSDGVPLPVGLFVDAKIAGSTLKDGLSIPRAALRNADEVYVVTENNSLSIRQVEVISADSARVVIGKGLAAGERVVISPVRAPREGMPVNPLTSSSAETIAVAAE
ncbi:MULTISPECIES: efflux RND transporter periplasmic adaptor subunit [unclassified Iodidimonas]|jgi:RND family efflux transporter MFP subunit|uniref:efflux RND transporter periplasmic adaptor subunit n=1 Tax=unclassified Iodidimonas TaxID=2626145 RepID=UPI00248322D1|nr:MULTISPECIES: efflux RND transporter periplasmic adaptor subunit [unclassified Iodidimonas]